MKIHTILMLICLAWLKLNAQENVLKVSKNQFKINVLTPGIVYEYGLSNKKTLYSEIGFGLGYQKSSFFGSTWTFYPHINEQFRYYYNLESRSLKNKPTTYNSGGFLGVAAIYGFKSLSSNPNWQSANSNFTIAPVWGFQRTYKRKFNLDMNMGPAYYIENDNRKFSFLLNFSLGWVIK